MASGAFAAAVPHGCDPGHAAGLQLGDDLVGDFVIKARPVVAGTGASGVFWTSRFSATGAASLSRGLQPVTANPVRTLTLYLHLRTRRDQLGSPWEPRGRVRSMREACRRAKIKPEISFHVLRHTHGSALAMKGVPMGVIAEQLGHADRG